MISRFYITAIAVFSLIGMSLAQAGQPIGTAKARGEFRNFGAAERSVSQSYSGYRYRAPVARSETVIVQAPTAAPEAAIAQAPAEERRFSHDPAAEDKAEAAAPAKSPCAGATVESGRRYSYAPEETAVAPVTSGQRAYSGRSNSRARSSATTSELWSLPKTDPRKFNSR